MIRSITTPEERVRLRAFVADAQDTAAVALLERHLTRPRYRSDFTLVALDAAQICGYALIAHTRWRLGVATLDAGTLEALHVAPEHAAASNALLGAYLGALFDQGLPLALCATAHSSVEPLGFAPYRLAAATQLAAHTDAPALLRAATPADLDDLAALYAESYAALPLTAVRAAPDWRAWLAETHNLRVLEDRRQRVSAYAAVEQRVTNGVVVREAAAADAGAARALLAALATVGAVALELPLAHGVTQAALHMGGAAQIDAPRGASGALAGVVDLAGVLAALAPEFERRLAHSRYADWSGSVQLETLDERVALVIAPRSVSIGDALPLADVRLQRVTLPALAQLCLGYRSAADLHATGELRADDADLGLIDTLFPTF